MLDQLGDLIQKAVDAIIRPPRMEYNHRDIPQVLESEDNAKYFRHPLLIENERQQNIVGSLYHSINKHPMDGGPCVIYLHGNASSQLEGQLLVPNLCQHGVYVFCYDAAGCGMSEGDYISLGHYESMDLKYLISWLHDSFSLGPFALWGRSMGAATAVMTHHPLIKCICVDSTYTSVRDLISSIGLSTGIPKMLIGTAAWYLKNRVKERAGFNLNDVCPLEMGKKGTAMAIFGHARADQFVPFEQGKMVFDEYRGNKKMMELTGGHNSARSHEWLLLCIETILAEFGIEHGKLQISTTRNLRANDFHFSSYEELLASHHD